MQDLAMGDTTASTCDAPWESDVAVSRGTPCGELTVTRVAQLTGIQRRTLRSWIRNRQVDASQKESRYRIDESFVRRVLDARRQTAIYGEFVPAGVAAEQIGVNTATFYNYMLRGIAVPHIAPTVVEEAVAECRCLEYDRRRRRLLLEAFRFVDHGHGYLDEATVGVLRRLNDVVRRGWVPLPSFVDRVAAKNKTELSEDELHRLYRKAANLCAKGELAAGRGLFSRFWHVEPLVAKRATLLFVVYSHRNLQLVLGDDRRLVERELRAALPARGDANRSTCKATLHTIGGRCMGYLYTSEGSVPSRWQAEVLPIPDRESQVQGLRDALDAVSRCMSSQRRAFLPACPIPVQAPWQTLAAFCRRKLNAREFHRKA